MLTIAEKINEEYYFDVFDEFIEVEKSNFIAGKFAERLNLSSVDKYTFHYILSLKTKKQANARAGVDLTFSAPKSVSILYSLLGDKKVLQAHTDAVKYTLSYIEENLNTTRVKKNKQTKYIKSELAFLCINHFFSRALDPQLHTHCIVPSTVFANGKYYSVDIKEIYKNSKFLGKIYREKLAENLKLLGYKIDVLDPGQFFFEIKGIDRSVISLFSTRDNEIKKALDELLKAKGVDRSITKAVNKFKKVIVYATRKKKKTVKDINEVQKFWQMKLRSINLTVDDLKKSVNNDLIQAKSREEIEKQLYILASRYFEIKEELERTEREKINVEEMLKNVYRRVEELKKEEEEREKKLKMLSEELKKAEEQHKRKEIESLSLKSEIENLKLTIQKAQEILFEKESEIEKINKKLNEKQDEIKKLEKALKDEEEKSSLLKDKNTALENKIKISEETLNKIEKEVSEKQKQLDKIAEKVASFERKEEIARGTYERLISTNKKLVDENNKLKKEAEELVEKINELRLEIENLESEKKKLSDEVVETYSVLETLRGKLISLIELSKRDAYVYNELKNDNDFKRAEDIIDDDDDIRAYRGPKGPGI